MPREPVHRNIDRRHQYLGLEPVDCLALMTLLWVLFAVNPDALPLNALVLAISYVALRVAKRGKPEGYTTDAVRYALSRRVLLSAAEIDHIGRAHPSPIAKEPHP
jgi:hypothetical protein